MGYGEHCLVCDSNLEDLIAGAFKKGAQLNAAGWLCTEGDRITPAKDASCSCCLPPTSRSLQLTKLIMTIGSELEPVPRPDDNTLTLCKEDNADEAEYKLNSILCAIIRSVRYNEGTSSNITRALHVMTSEDWIKLVPQHPILLMEMELSDHEEISPSGDLHPSRAMITSDNETECELISGQPGGDSHPQKVNSSCEENLTQPRGDLHSQKVSLTSEKDMTQPRGDLHSQKADIISEKKMTQPGGDSNPQKEVIKRKKKKKSLTGGDSHSQKEEQVCPKLSDNQQKSENIVAQSRGDSHSQKTDEINNNKMAKSGGDSHSQKTLVINSKINTPRGDSHPQKDDSATLKLFRADRNKNKILDKTINWEYDEEAWEEAKNETINKEMEQKSLAISPKQRNPGANNIMKPINKEGSRHEENEQTTSAISPNPAAKKLLKPSEKEAKSKTKSSIKKGSGSWENHPARQKILEKRANKISESKLAEKNCTVDESIADKSTDSDGTVLKEIRLPEELDINKLPALRAVLNPSANEKWEINSNIKLFPSVTLTRIKESDCSYFNVSERDHITMPRGKKTAAARTKSKTANVFNQKKGLPDSKGKPEVSKKLPKITSKEAPSSLSDFVIPKDKRRPTRVRDKAEQALKRECSDVSNQEKPRKRPKLRKIVKNLIIKHDEDITAMKTKTEKSNLGLRLDLKIERRKRMELEESFNKAAKELAELKALMASKPADTTAVPRLNEELPLMTATEDKIEIVESESEEDLVFEATPADLTIASPTPTTSRPPTDTGPMKRMIKHHLHDGAKTATAPSSSAPAPAVEKGLEKASVISRAEEDSKSPPAGGPNHSHNHVDSSNPDRRALKYLQRHDPHGVAWVEKGFESLNYGSQAKKKVVVNAKLIQQGFSGAAVKALDNKLTSNARAEVINIITVLLCRYNNYILPASVPTAMKDPHITGDMMMARIELLAPPLAAEILSDWSLIEVLKMSLVCTKTAASAEPKRPGLNYAAYPERRSKHLPPAPTQPVQHLPDGAESRHVRFKPDIHSRLGRRSPAEGWIATGNHQQKFRADQKTSSSGTVDRSSRPRTCARDDRYWEEKELVRKRTESRSSNPPRSYSSRSPRDRKKPREETDPHRRRN